MIKRIRGTLLDVEGTTTPISFVHNVLFPFARKHVQEFLDEQTVKSLQLEHDADVADNRNPPSWAEGALAYVHWLMDSDRKSTALKQLQGRVWLEGYTRGELRGDVFPDVRKALERWRREGRDVRIYSSGSILAQQLLFSTTAYGDLTTLINGYFDTKTGAKIDASSYSAIAKAFVLPPQEILFVSDVTRELDAANAAGFQVVLADRPGNLPQPQHNYQMIHNFDEL
jgi:enolase-phosphatase E1